MSLTRQYARAALLITAALSLSACSGGSTSRIDYKEAKTLPSLEVPPELDMPVDTGVENMPALRAETDEGQAVAGGATRVLPLGEGIDIAGDGRIRWLVINTPADALWPRLRQFWASLGLEVKRDEPTVGIMETQWAENRADAPGGFLTGMVKKVFKDAYSADTRDKYRIRLEPREDGRTELFLTHYGLKETVAGQTLEGFVDTAWEVRPSDPELANEVLNRLVLYLGGSEEVAEAVRSTEEAAAVRSRARIDGDMVVLEEGFSRAWRLTGLALDRIGLVVDDRDRSQGIYYVSRVDLLEGVEDEEGWFGSLFSGSDEADKPQQWQVHLVGGDSNTRIRLRDAEGGDKVPEKLRENVLKLLQESLR